MDEEMKKININEAGVEELAQIPGIAENLARRIIEYRETVHPFEEVIELAAVPGISERMVREFADWVTVEPVAMMERTASVPDITLEPKAEPVVEELLDEAEVFEFVTEPEEELAEVVEDFEAEIEAATEAEDEVVEDVAEEIAAETAEEVEAVVEETVEEVEEAVEATAVPDPIQPEDDTDTAELPPLFESMKVEPDPEPEPAPRPVPEPVRQPRQRMLGPILLGSLLGAAIGVILTLAILAGLNDGTLSFTQADSRLQSEIQDAQRSQSDLLETVDTLDSEINSDLDVLVTRTDGLYAAQQDTYTSINDLAIKMQQTEASIAELEAMTDALDERLTTVAAAAETFDAFLDGLRDLLIELDGGAVPEEAEVEATPEAEVSPTVDSAEADGATAVPTTRPTRTPRPTATAVPVPTSTPVQQP